MKSFLIAFLLFSSLFSKQLFAQGASPKPYVQPYISCKDLNGKKVCANVGVTGATELGTLYSEVASCEDVRTQRRFYVVPPASTTKPDDLRLQDEAFMKELAWVTKQTESTGCVCCHRSASMPGAAIWDSSSQGIWTDQLSNRGVALLSGKMPSDVLGFFKEEENFGFNRQHTAIPTTDVARMKNFFLNELKRRNVTDEQIKNFAPLGGTFFDNVKSQNPTLCGADQGISSDGIIQWTGGAARYIYILKALAANPLIPPSGDTPDGTIWRLNVHHNANALSSGLLYGSFPEGTYQRIPENNRLPELKSGTVYRLYVLKDVLFPITNCFFEFGRDSAVL